MLKNLIKSIVAFGLAVPLFATAQTTDTPNIGLQVPATSQANWQIQLNYNWNAIDALLSGNTALPGLLVSGQANLPQLTTWTATASYSSGAYVFYQGVLYQSLIGSNGNNIPSSTPSAWTTSISGGGGGQVGALLAINNLSDLSSISTARTNLGLGSAALDPSSAFDAAGAATTAQTNAQTSSLQKANNLSDLPSASAARTNLGLGTAATVASSAFDAAGTAAAAQAAAQGSSLQKVNNLSDVASVSSARANLGLGTAATQSSAAFDSAGAAAAAAATAQSAAEAVSLQDANNLSDLTNVATARANLGLGTAATSLTTNGSSGSATLVAGVLNIPQYAGGGSVPTATAANQAPVSIGAGTTYTAQNVILSSPGAGVSQSIAQQNGTQLHLNNVTVYNGALIDTINAALVNTTYYVDGFVAAGIGQPGVAWASGTLYQQCQEVSHAGGNYLEITEGGDNSTTPGTNSQIWYPITNGSIPSQLDCAFYVAAAHIVSGTGTVANGLGATVMMGNSVPYYTNIGLTEPTVTSPGQPVVNIIGQGSTITTIKQGSSKGDGLATVYQPPATNPYAFSSFIFKGFTVDSNYSASAAMNLYGTQRMVLDDLILADATDGSDHELELGEFSDTAHGWVFEPHINNIQLGTFRGFGSGAVVATAVSGGVPSFTMTSGGSNYAFPDVKVVLAGTSDFGRPCNVMGITTPTITGGVITGITSTATGCVAPLYAIVYAGADINYGVKLSNVSDRGEIGNIVNGGVGWLAGLYISNITNVLTINNYHPESVLVGMQIYGGANITNLQCDTVFQYCLDIESGGGTINVVNPTFEWNNSNMTASRDYYFGLVNGTPGYSEPQAVNISGETCGDPALQPGYAHFDSSSGVIDASIGSDSGYGVLPPYVHVINPSYCNQQGLGNSVQNANPTLEGQDIQLSNGAVGNQWDFSLGANGLNGGTQTLSIIQPNSTSAAYVGAYTLDLLNPTASTSGQNHESPIFGELGTYWNGTTSSAMGISQKLIFGSGANPVATYSTSVTGAGTPGGVIYAWDNVIRAPAVTDSGLTTGCVFDLNGALTSTAPSGYSCGTGSGLSGLSAGYPVGASSSTTLAPIKVFDVDLFPASGTVGGTAYTTQLDVAFYTAKAYVATNNIPATLRLHSGVYTTSASLVEPTGTPNFINLWGDSQLVSTIKYTGTTAQPVISRNDANSNAFASIRDLTIDGNYTASAIWSLIGLNQSNFSNVTGQNIAANSNYNFFLWAAGFQVTADNLQAFEGPAGSLGNFSNAGVTFGYVTCIPSGGNVATAQCSLTSTGSGYPSGYATAQMAFNGFQGGTAAKPCSTMPVGTATIAGGAVSTWSITTNATGCGTGTFYGTISAVFPSSFGFVVEVTDSTFTKLTSSVGAFAGFWTPTSGDKFYDLHPEFTPIGIYNQSASLFVGTELDNTLTYGFDLAALAGGACTTGRSCNATIIGTTGFGNSTQIQSPATFYQEAIGVPANIAGNDALCGANGVCPTGWAELVTSTGVVDNGVAAIPANSSMYGDDYQASSLGDYTPKLTIGSILAINGNIGLSATNQNTLVTGYGKGAGSAAGTYGLLFANNVPANIGQNYNSPTIGIGGTYWNGSASAVLGIDQQLTFSSGANPAATFATAYTGVLPTGGLTYTWDNPIKAPGITATGSVSVGTAPPNTVCPPTVTGCLALGEGTVADVPTAGQDALHANGTTHTITATINGNPDVVVATAIPTWHVVMAPVNLTGQAASIAPTTLLTPATAGYYRLCMNTDTTQAATTSSTMVSLFGVYTDANDSVTKYPAVVYNTNTANVTATAYGACVAPLYVKAGTAIQYQTSNYASSGATAMQYDLQVTLEVLE